MWGTTRDAAISVFSSLVLWESMVNTSTLKGSREGGLERYSLLSLRKTSSTGAAFSLGVTEDVMDKVEAVALFKRSPFSHSGG